LIGFYLTQFLIGFSYGFLAPAAVANMTEADLDTFSYGVWILCIIVVYIPVTAWVLLKKGRSLAWILLSVFFFLPLWIGNKRQVKGAQEISSQAAKTSMPQANKTANQTEVNTNIGNFCYNCGTELNTGMTYCPKCGRKLG
jgi:hypothetical protein